jgi:hypothetical protein
MNQANGTGGNQPGGGNNPPATNLSSGWFEPIGTTAYRIINGGIPPNNTVIPAIYNGLPVTEIGQDAFSDNYNLTSVTIPNSVLSIHQGAFSGTGLTNVTIPNSVTFIGNGAFEDCTSLISVTISNSITVISANMFTNTALTNLVLPNSVSEIQTEAFMDCIDLLSVTIGTGVTDIGDRAFMNCELLATVIINRANPPTLGGDVFSGTAGDLRVYIPENSTNNYLSSPWALPPLGPNSFIQQ